VIQDSTFTSLVDQFLIKNKSVTLAILDTVAGRPAPEKNVDSKFAQIIARMEKTTDAWEFGSLLDALATVRETERAHSVLVQFWPRMEKFPFSNADAFKALLKSLVEVLGAALGDRKPQELIDIIKFPTCVREFRVTLLAKLEQQTGQKFEGNVWKMAEWAQANGYDVKSPPQRPGK
jgi:hypothetical protein